jgi:hypothetical protein
MIPRPVVTGVLGALAGSLFTLAFAGGPSPEADALTRIPVQQNVGTASAVALTTTTYSPTVADVRKGLATLFDEAAFATDNGSTATPSGRQFRDDFQLLVRRVVQAELIEAVDCINSWHNGGSVANLYCPLEGAPVEP